MRSAQKNNRSRGRGNRKSGGGGGNVVNRVFDSAGPEGKVRGTPQQIIDKYLSLARDAQTSNDRVAAENFLQHAEHYQRLLMQATAQQEQSRRDQPDAGQDYDGDDGDGRGDGRDDRGGRDDRDGRDNRDRDGGQGERRAEQPRQQRHGGDDDGSNADEIGGMTTIDSGRPGDDNLLVVSEEAPQGQQRRNGDGRRRRPRRDADAGQDTAQAETDQQARSEN